MKHQVLLRGAEAPHPRLSEPYMHVRLTSSCVQANWRGAAARHRWRALVRGAVAAQACARRLLAARRFRALRAAAVALQAAWRARRARLQLRAHRAARALQARQPARPWALS